MIRKKSSKSVEISLENFAYLLRDTVILLANNKRPTISSCLNQAIDAYRERRAIKISDESRKILDKIFPLEKSQGYCFDNEGEYVDFLIKKREAELKNN